MRVPVTDRLATDGGTPVRDEPLPLGRGMRYLGDEELVAVTEVMRSRSLFRYYGPDLQHKAEGFEAGVRAMIGTRNAVALSSGTGALRCALAAVGAGCGDEVIVPSFTFIATVNAVVATGAVPVFCEVDASLNMDPSDLEAQITDRTVAAICVHLENVACDMERLRELTSRRGIALVEDAAQAMGASYRGRSLGTIGDIGCFSLQLDKNITSGEGGVLVSDDEALFVRAARYSDQGGQFVTKYGVERGDELTEPFCGENLRITELAAAIADVQLARLSSIIDGQRTNKRRILDTVGEVDGLQRRTIHDPDGDGASSITWFASDAEIARRFASELRAEGIPAGQMYGGRPVYVHPQIAQRRTASGKGGPWHCAEHPTDRTYGPGLCRRTEELVARSFLVGVGSAFTEADCADVAAAISKVSAAVL